MNKCEQCGRKGKLKKSMFDIDAELQNVAMFGEKILCTSCIEDNDKERRKKRELPNAFYKDYKY